MDNKIFCGECAYYYSFIEKLNESQDSKMKKWKEKMNEMGEDIGDLKWYNVIKKLKLYIKISNTKKAMMADYWDPYWFDSDLRKVKCNKKIEMISPIGIEYRSPDCLEQNKNNDCEHYERAEKKE